MKATDNPRVRVKIDDGGNVVGFHITSVSKAAKQKPFEVDLVPKGGYESQSKLRSGSNVLTNET